MGFEFGVKDERGASPVVGIVILVAITVVVGGVVAGFVFDLGRNNAESMPTAQLDIEDASPVLNASEEAFVLNHDTGADVKTDELVLVIEKGGAEEYRGVLKTVGTGSGNKLDASSGDGTYIENVDTLSAGQQVDVSDPGNTVFTPGETYSFTIIHEPSQGIMLEEEVKLV